MEQRITDIADNLTVTTGKLKSLAYLFSENYTVCRLDAVTEEVRRNPEAFVVAFSVIEDLIADVDGIAHKLTEQVYRAKRGEAV